MALTLTSPSGTLLTPAVVHRHNDGSLHVVGVWATPDGVIEECLPAEEVMVAQD